MKFSGIGRSLKGDSIGGGSKLVLLAIERTLNCAHWLSHSSVHCKPEVQSLVTSSQKLNGSQSNLSSLVDETVFSSKWGKGSAEVLFVVMDASVGMALSWGYNCSKQIEVSKNALIISSLLISSIIVVFNVSVKLCAIQCSLNENDGQLTVFISALIFWFLPSYVWRWMRLYVSICICQNYFLSNLGCIR